jgi:hypothetical protein
MKARVRVVDYFYAMVRDHPGEGCKILSSFAREAVNLLAFNAVPVGHEQTQLVVFPEHTDRLVRAAEKGGVKLLGPHRAILIQDDDRLGALVGYLQKLCDAKINMSSSWGVTDGRGGYGYVIHVRAEDVSQAARVLGAD